MEKIFMMQLYFNMKSDVFYGRAYVISEKIRQYKRRRKLNFTREYAFFLLDGILWEVQIAL